jgi:hypothetical protein
VPEETPQRKNQKKAPKTRPADDMLDGEDIRQWENPLAQVISDIHASLYETYDEYNRQAMVKQHRHVWFSRTAVFFGTLAILLSILQVFLRAYPDYLVNNPDLAIFEKGAFFTAIIAIGIAMGSRLLRDWLKQRYLAEQCRSLKFRALIHPYLSFSSEGDWNERFAKWKKRFDLKVADLKKKEDWSLEKILVVDTINAPPHESSGRSLNVPYLLMLTDYYQKKRISTQVAYFSAQARTFRNKNKITEWIPQYCFLGGVVCAALQFIIEFFYPNVPTAGKAIILLLTLVLPSIGVASKTLRSSVEVARNASLFSAKCRALRQFEMRLQAERAKEVMNWREILNIMWESENFFESENREWLRIMHDAEWFL